MQILALALMLLVSCSIYAVECKAVQDCASGVCRYISVCGVESESERNRRAESEKLKRQNEQIPKLLNLDVQVTNPDSDGNFIISLRTNADTASLKINGFEHGGRADGRYSIKKVARAGQTTEFLITATDIHGNYASTTVAVNRPVNDSKPLTQPSQRISGSVLQHQGIFLDLATDQGTTK